MAERTLWLQTSSGLASRMRAVVGALAYCKATDRRLIIDWPRKEPSETLGTFDAKFSDLWMNDIEETDCGRRFPGLRMDNAVILDQAPAQLHLRTCHIEPFLKWMPENKPGQFAWQLKPVTDIVEIIKRTKLSFSLQDDDDTPFSQLMVGVNIRHALRQPSVAEPEWFVERMLAMDNTRGFFCSLDSLYVEQLLREEFGDRVFCQRKDYVYNRDGIIKTCADLYLLAACDYVIGSNYSSYSQMVAFMRGAQYIGPHDKAGRGLVGGNYEDMWNPPDAALS